MFKWKNKTLDGFEQEKIKKNFLPYTILVAALFAMTFFGVCTPNQGPSGPKGPAAYVDNEVITFKEFRRAYNNQTQRLRGQYGDDYDPAKLNIARNTLQQLVGSRIDYLYALELGVVSSEKEVYDFLSSADVFKDESGKFSPENFKNFLRANGYSESTFFKEWERNLTVQKLNRLITQSTFVSTGSVELDYVLSETKMNVEYIAVQDGSVKVNVSKKEITDYVGNKANDAAISAYYDKNAQEFNSPEKVKASHILVAFKGSRNASGDAAKRSKKDAKKLADKIAGLAKKGSFSTLAKKHTDDPSGKKNGGDLGSFTRQMMVKEFSDAAFSMKAGQVSKAVESPFGYHIIKVFKKEKAVSKTLEESKRVIAKNIIEKEKAPKAAKELADALLKDLKAKKSVKSKLKTNKLAWAETGEFSVSSPFIPKLGADPIMKTKLFKNPSKGKVIGEVVSFGGSNYILRTKSFKKADKKKIKEGDKERLAMSAGYSQGYQFYSALSKSNRESYDTRNAVQYNDSYLKLDAPAQN